MSPLEALAERHQDRGNAHLTAGSPAYAEGSFRKAMKARGRQRSLDAALGNKHGPLQPKEAVVQRILAETSVRMERDFEAVFFGAGAR